MLIALGERVVGFYACLVGINAYHQPGVEAGKKAGNAVVALKRKLVGGAARRPPGLPADCRGSGRGGRAAIPEFAFKVLEHLAANGVVRKQARDPLV